MHRTTRSLAILGAAMALSAAPAFAAEPPPGIAFDGVVTVVFHDPEYDNGNGIPDADVMLWVLDLNGVPIDEQYLGMTDASGVVTFTDVFRVVDPSLEFELEASAVTERTFVDDDGCSVYEFVAGSATAPTGLEVTIDVEIDTHRTKRTCGPPVEAPPFVVEGNAVDPAGEPLEILYAGAKLDANDDIVTVPIETAADGSFRVDVPGAADASFERLLEVTLIGPDVRTVEDEEGCLITWTLVARWSWTLVGTEAPEPTTLVASEEPLSGVCGGETATPRPPDAPNAPNAPNITLPPTDTIGGGFSDLGGGLAAALLLLLVISLAATIAAERRVSRRGS